MPALRRGNQRRSEKCRFCNEWLAPQPVTPVAPPPIVINSAALEKNVKPVVNGILAAVQYFVIFVMLAGALGSLESGFTPFLAPAIIFVMAIMG